LTVTLTGFWPFESCTSSRWSPVGWTSKTEMLLLPALVARRSCRWSLPGSTRLFGPISPWAVARTSPFALSSKLPLPVPPVS
jgi:hypothetical protein